MVVVTRHPMQCLSCARTSLWGRGRGVVVVRGRGRTLALPHDIVLTFVPSLHRTDQCVRFISCDVLICESLQQCFGMPSQRHSLPTPSPRPSPAGGTHPAHLRSRCQLVHHPSPPHSFAMPQALISVVLPALVAMGINIGAPDQFPLHMVVRNLFLPPTPESLPAVHSK
jgi:hypothetical protein